MPYGLQWLARGKNLQVWKREHELRVWIHINSGGTGTKIFSGCQPGWVLSGPWVGGPAPPRVVDRRRLLQWFAARLQSAVPGYIGRARFF
jgi:hypothetical protein